MVGLDQAAGIGGVRDVIHDDLELKRLAWCLRAGLTKEACNVVHDDLELNRFATSATLLFPLAEWSC